MIMAVSFQKQEERKARLSQLAEKGLAELYKLASDLKIGSEDLLRILANVQGISPELGRRIDFLWQIRFGKVLIKAPKPELIPPITSPKPLEIERKCSLLIHIDALEHNLIAYFAINYKDFLTEHIEYPHYDEAIDRPRKYLNEFFVNFTRVKDKSMGLVESELSMEVRYDEECPKKYRVFEMEMIEIETETLRYGLKYANGRVLKSVGNIPIKEIIRILRREKVWE